jgi:Fe-S cluster biogenesis protein NfuA
VTSAAPTPQDIADGLKPVRQRLRGHGGDLHVIGLTSDGNVEVEFIGACRGCPALAFTFSVVVVPAAEALPGVTGVTSRQTKFSRHVAARVRSVGARNNVAEGRLVQTATKLR